VRGMKGRRERRGRFTCDGFRGSGSVLVTLPSGECSCKEYKHDDLSLSLALHLSFVPKRMRPSYKTKHDDNTISNIPQERESPDEYYVREETCDLCIHSVLTRSYPLDLLPQAGHQPAAAEDSGPVSPSERSRSSSVSSSISSRLISS